jgi:hypothetical protein
LLGNKGDFARFVPILALIHEHNADPDMRPYKEPISEEQRDHLLAGVAEAVTGTYRYFAAHRQRAHRVGKTTSLAQRKQGKDREERPLLLRVREEAQEVLRKRQGELTQLNKERQSRNLRLAGEAVAGQGEAVQGAEDGGGDLVGLEEELGEGLKLLAGDRFDGGEDLV